VVEQLRSESVAAADDLVIALIANKCDILPAAGGASFVSQSDLDTYAAAQSIPVVGLASCKTGQGVASLVRQVADRLAALPDDGADDDDLHRADETTRGGWFSFPGGSRRKQQKGIIMPGAPEDGGGASGCC